MSYEVEAATGFFESICVDSPFEYNNSDTSSVSSSSDTGHGANNIISSTGDGDDEDDEEVVFGAGAYHFQPRFPPGAARDRRPP